MAQPAATGTADYRSKGYSIKPEDQQKATGASRDKTKGSSGRQSVAPVPTKPDKLPPSPHRMGPKCWNMERRKLDALFAMYIMGWETKANEYSEWRYYIKQLEDGRWESDILGYFHDDTRSCYKGIEVLRKQGLYITVESNKDGYEAIERSKGISVKDPDLNYAIMALCLLLKGIDKEVIQNAWLNQDDYSLKAAKLKARRSWSNE